jgi:hypothetical protein
MRCSVGVSAVGAIALCTMASCVVDRPMADTSTANSLSAKAFAVDCRAWVTTDGAIEAEAALVDFAEGAGDLQLQWSVDDRTLPATREMRPRVTRGHFLKYSLTRRLLHRFDTPGEHTVGMTITNETRSARCVMTVSVG